MSSSTAVETMVKNQANAGNRTKQYETDVSDKHSAFLFQYSYQMMWELLTKLNIMHSW